jgi:DNA-binding NarL/FixJ family response regulator
MAKTLRYSMPTLSPQGPMWWDRDVDRAGRTIRGDVRNAAHEIWQQMRSTARSVLGDDCDAADVMETSVEAVSQYLNRRNTCPSAMNVAGVLTVAFRRQLQKRRLKRRRLELVGGVSEMEQRFHSVYSTEQIDRLLDLEKIIARLSPRNQRILLRRREGLDWKAIADELGIAVSTSQNSFWREIRQAQKTQQKTRKNRSSAMA